MSRRAAAILLLVMGAAVGALLYLTWSPSSTSESRRSLPFLRVTPAVSGATPASSGPAVPVETIRVTLFFADAAQGKLHPEERDIPKPSGPGGYLRALFEELARGPSRPGLVGVIPPRLQLRSGFLLPNGEVVLDLAVDESLSFGSAEELSIVASLVDTALQNVANTKRVRILVNGEPVESLGGHVDLTRPLTFVRSELAS